MAMVRFLLCVEKQKRTLLVFVSPNTGNKRSYIHWKVHRSITAFPFLARDTADPWQFGSPQHQYLIVISAKLVWGRCSIILLLSAVLGTLSQIYTIRPQMNLLIQLICLLSLVNIRGSAAAAVNIASQHTVCLTAEECYEQSKVLSIIGITSFSAGVHDGMYGCFFRGNTAYFGFGGSDEDMSRTDLDGIRIFCATSTSTDADSQVDVTTIT